MTDSNQTIPVPLDLLKPLCESDPNDGGSFGTVYLAIQDLRKFIHKPPKVGDQVTFEQIADLPERSVLIDADGDVYVVDSVGDAVRVTDTDGGSVRAHAAADKAQEGLYGPYTIVHLAEPRD